MKFMATCKEVSGLMSQAQDRRLGAGEKFKLNVHLMMCRGCRNFGDQLLFIRAAVKRYVGRDDNGRASEDPASAPALTPVRAGAADSQQQRDQ